METIKTTMWQGDPEQIEHQEDLHRELDKLQNHPCEANPYATTREKEKISDALMWLSRLKSSLTMQWGKMSKEETLSLIAQSIDILNGDWNPREGE